MAQNPESGRTYTAGATIMPRRFVKLSAANTVVHAADETDTVFGVSGDNARRFDDTSHALAGEGCQVIGMNGDTPFVEVGSAITVGDFVVAGTSGKAFPATLSAVTGSAFTNIFAVGPALDSGAEGEFIRVQMTPRHGIIETA